MRFRLSLASGLKQCRPVIIKSGFAGCVLGLFGQGRNLYRPSRVAFFNAKFARRGSNTPLVAMTTAIISLTFISVRLTGLKTLVDLDPLRDIVVALHKPSPRLSASFLARVRVMVRVSLAGAKSSIAST